MASRSLCAHDNFTQRPFLHCSRHARCCAREMNGSGFGRGDRGSALGNETLTGSDKRNSRFSRPSAFSLRYSSQSAAGSGVVGASLCCLTVIGVSATTGPFSGREQSDALPVSLENRDATEEHSRHPEQVHGGGSSQRHSELPQRIPSATEHAQGCHPRQIPS
jgi:hypothetical protein